MSAPAARVAQRADRGLVEVTGDDRVRWLDGMVSNDVQGLHAGGPRACCQALLLTPQGRIVADLHVWAHPDRLWLELDAEAVAKVLERLERYVIADDVTLRDAGGEWAHLGVEGVGASEVLGAALGPAARVASGEVAEVVWRDVALRIGGYGLASATGRQVLVPRAGADAVSRALRDAGASPADAASLEVLRVESGLPRLGRELDEEVLPAEARLDAAVSTTKGCYTGQEVVARMRSRGRVAHLLVGLAFAGELPPAGSELSEDGRVVGEVTSAVRSPAHGEIGLGFVRSALAGSARTLDAGGVPARIVALPFGSAAGSGAGEPREPRAGDGP